MPTRSRISPTTVVWAVLSVASRVSSTATRSPSLPHWLRAAICTAASSSAVRPAASGKSRMVGSSTVATRFRPAINWSLSVLSPCLPTEVIQALPPPLSKNRRRLS